MGCLTFSEKARQPSRKWSDRSSETKKRITSRRSCFVNERLVACSVVVVVAAADDVEVEGCEPQGAGDCLGGDEGILLGISRLFILLLACCGTIAVKLTDSEVGVVQFHSFVRGHPVSSRIPNLPRYGINHILMVRIMCLPRISMTVWVLCERLILMKHEDAKVGKTNRTLELSPYVSTSSTRISGHKFAHGPVLLNGVRWHRD